MKKQKPPFPIYDVEQREFPSCGRGEECDPHENPAHHVAVDLTSEARGVIEHLIFSLCEAHDENMIAEFEANMDTRAADIARVEKWHKKDDPTCSYCVAVRDGNALLKFAQEVR